MFTILLSQNGLSAPPTHTQDCRVVATLALAMSAVSLSGAGMPCSPSPSCNCVRHSHHLFIAHFSIAYFIFNQQHSKTMPWRPLSTSSALSAFAGARDAILANPSNPHPLRPSLLSDLSLPPPVLSSLHFFHFSFLPCLISPPYRHFAVCHGVQPRPRTRWRRGAMPSGKSQLHRSYQTARTCINLRKRHFDSVDCTITMRMGAHYSEQD